MLIGFWVFEEEQSKTVRQDFTRNARILREKMLGFQKLNSRDEGIQIAPTAIDSSGPQLDCHVSQVGVAIHFCQPCQPGILEVGTPLSLSLSLWQKLAKNNQKSSIKPLQTWDTIQIIIFLLWFSCTTPLLICLNSINYYKILE